MYNFFPATIGCLVWEKLYPDKCDTFRRIGRYVSFTLFINCVLFLGLHVVLSSTEGLLTSLNEMNMFSAEYMVAFTILACTVPYIFRFVETKVSLQVRKSERKHMERKHMERKLRIQIPWRIVAFVYAVMVFVMNFVRIFDENFWGDEGYSIILARMPLKDMFVGTAGDVHPPLYYIFLMIGNRILGDFGWVYHLISIMPLFFILVFALTVVWKRFGKEASFLFITLVGTSSQAIVYNVEVRMYSWAFLFVLLSFWFLFSIMENKLYAEIPFILFSLAAAYTHYYALFSVAFFYLALLLLCLLKKYPLKRLMMVYCFTIMGYLPWLIQMLTTFKRTSENFWIKDTPGFLTGLRYYFQSVVDVYSDFIWCIIALGCMIIILRETKIIRVQKEEDKFCVHIFDNVQELATDTAWLCFGLLAAFGTLAIAELISLLIRPAFLLRYLYPVASVVWLVLCVIISKLKWRSFVGTVIIIISFVVFLPDYVITYRHDKDISDRCVVTWNEMKGMITEDDILLTDFVHLNWTLLDYYFPQNEHKLVSEEYDTLESGKQYWLVWSSDLDNDDVTWLEDNGLEAEEKLCGGIIGSETVHVYYLKWSE